MRQVSFDHWPYPRWVAHRGAGKLAPENTLAAFRLGASHGYRMFECDAKLSRDECVFLLHDDTLQRTTNAPAPQNGASPGLAGDWLWDALARLDAGAWHSRQYAGESLPTLANLARYCRANNLLLNIEIKPTPGLEARTGTVVAQAAEALWHGADIPPLLTSFQPQSLAAAQRAAPTLPRGLLLDSLWDGWFDTARQLDCVAMVCKHTLWDAALVQQVHGSRMRCLSYTVNTPDAAQRLLDLGTDAIITDAVDQFAPA